MSSSFETNRGAYVHVNGEDDGECIKALGGRLSARSQ